MSLLDILNSFSSNEEHDERFPDTDWWCDSCNSYLNSQEGFDDHKYVWKCTNCGFKSSISKDNIY